VPKTKNTKKIALLEQQITELQSELDVLRKVSEVNELPEVLPFWQFAENIPDIVLIHEMDGTISFINKIGVKALGFSDKNELIGQNLIDFTPPSQIKETLKRKNTREIGNQTPQKYTTEIYTKEKKPLPVEAHSSIINYNNKAYVFVIIHDITDRLNKQAEIAKHEIMFRNLFEYSPIAKINYDTQGKIMHCNLAFEVLLGIHKTKIIGKNLSDIFDQTSLIKTLLNVKEIKDSVNPSIFELSYQKRSIKLFIRKVTNEKHETSSIIALFDDITEQKKLETERQIIQNRLQRAENIANIGNWEFDLNTNRVDTSVGAQQIYGLSKPEMTIADVQKVPLPRYRNLLDNALEALIKGEKPYNVHFKIKRLNDNQLRDIQSIAEYDPKRNRVFGVIRDITTEKRQQEEIEESEARFRTLFYENTSVMMLIDPDTGEIADVNNAAIDFYGYTLNELCGMNISNINILSAEEIANEIDNARSGRKQVFQFKHRIKNGEIHNVEVFTGLVKLQSRPLLYSTIHDVTEREKAINALRENEERLRLALSASKQGLWDINLQNGTTNISPEYAEMLGYSYDTFSVDQYWEKNLHPDDYESTTKRFWGYINGEYDDYKMEFRLRTKSDNYKWILSRGKIIQWDKDNKPIRMIGIHMDISKMKQVETELLEAKEKAESSNRLKTAFLQNMSHEIRTPMNGIMGFSDLLKDEELVEVERNEYIDIIHRNSRQLLRIVNDILDISRLDAGEIQIENQTFDLISLLKSEKQFFKKQAIERGLFLNTALNYKLNEIILYSDPVRIKQILDNLISNAIKFTKKGGITIGLKIENACYVVFVKDTGIGIPKKDNKTIFKRFGQIHTHLVEGGTGLGLPISQKLATMLGGELTFKSEPNKGSVFKLSLPKVK